VVVPAEGQHDAEDVLGNAARRDSRTVREEHAPGTNRLGEILLDASRSALDPAQPARARQEIEGYAEAVEDLGVGDLAREGLVVVRCDEGDVGEAAPERLENALGDPDANVRPEVEVDDDLQLSARRRCPSCP
jgi:hypothetical protein